MKWFISDLHLDNKRLFEGFRKDHFGTMEAWQEAMIDGIRRSVRKTDQLFLLGDIAYDPKELFRWRRKMPGQVWLIKGNHDPSDAACERVFGRQFRYGFETKIAGTRYWLSHYPHAFWPDSHNGSCHLYGHCHGKREETLDTWMPQRRSMEGGDRDSRLRLRPSLQGQQRAQNQQSLLQLPRGGTPCSERRFWPTR
jgi:calcineurin-like phosphoesterase family protein